jgi:hypothetical protein
MIDLCLTSIQLTIMFVWYKVGLIGIKRGIRGLPCVSDSNSGLHQCCPTPKCRLNFFSLVLIHFHHCPCTSSLSVQLATPSWAIGRSVKKRLQALQGKNSSFAWCITWGNIRLCHETGRKNVNSCKE